MNARDVMDNLRPLEYHCDKLKRKLPYSNSQSVFHHESQCNLPERKGHILQQSLETFSCELHSEIKDVSV